jgi:Leu/Phe-tRNA-protein transferase
MAVFTEGALAAVRSVLLHEERHLIGGALIGLWPDFLFCGQSLIASNARASRYNVVLTAFLA